MDKVEYVEKIKEMKVLLINKYYYIKGGAEVCFFSLKNLLEKKHYNIVPFSMKDSRNFYTEYNEYFVNNIDYNNLNLFKKIIAAIKIIYNFEAKRKISKLIKDTKPDIAHIHNFYHQLSPSILNPIKKKNIPIIFTVHDLKVICPNYQMLNSNGICEKCRGKKFYNCIRYKCVKNSRINSLVVVFEAYIHEILKSYNLVDIFITPSRFLRDKLIEYGFEKDKVRYIPNFVNVYEYVPYYGFDNYYIYFGRLSYEKGIMNLIQAAKNINKIPLLIVGSGPVLNEIRRYIEQENIKNIYLKGFKTGEELKNLISKSKFVVMPSICYENNPMSVIESMAYGKAVIGSNIGGIPELINNKELLFNYNDISSLEEKINYMINLTREDIEKIGKDNRKYIEDNCSEEIHYEKLSKIYDEVRNKSKGQ
ncbi:Capsular glucan synthase [uncultured Clostridium sp.]|uniref:glycosyltransferase family 4 protein n=1 Tax=uncultured Clostridium sp. TaxID=59620 RepID=UPI000822276D|nr:glycosyltransferase family 4 protein [uncultured Clostridium sp.]SCJ73054.1 Capsular glucan synthase [uncultured Clostridium sp.]